MEENFDDGQNCGLFKSCDKWSNMQKKVVVPCRWFQKDIWLHGYHQTQSWLLNHEYPR